MGSLHHSQAIRPDTAYIKKIIESGLLADWLIRIEYRNSVSQAGDWQLWEQSHFALRSAKPVIKTLLDCYTKQPGSIIRICAERFRPQTRLLYTVYYPQYLTDQTDFKAQASSHEIAQAYEQPTTFFRLTTP